MRHFTAIPLVLLLTAGIVAQPPCDGRGSSLQPARTETGPALGCAFAPQAPGYHLFTPEHRAVTRRIGYHLGEARALDAWLVRYRCTGLWLLPVVISEVRAYGYVLDVAEHACAVAQRASAAAPGG